MISRLCTGYGNQIAIRSNQLPSRATSPRKRITAPERRERILEAATAVFAEHGYEGASIHEIAGRAGVVASVIYDHFASKRDLHIELLERHGEALIERSVRLIEAASYEELFRVNVEAFYEFVEDNPFVWRMLFRDPPGDPEVAEAHRRIQERATEAIALLVASVRPGEEVIPGVPRTQANVMLAEGIKSAINGLAGWWYERREVPREQVVRVLEELLWGGLGGVASRGPNGL